MHRPSPSENEFNRRGLEDDDDDNDETLDESNTPTLVFSSISSANRPISTLYRLERPAFIIGQECPRKTMTIGVTHHRKELSNGKSFGENQILIRGVATIFTFSSHQNGKATVCDESRSGVLIESRSSIDDYSLTLETSSILDPRDTSYLNEIPSRQKQGRRRADSVSDVDNRSVQSDDVRTVIDVEHFFEIFFDHHRSDRSRQPIRSNHVSHARERLTCRIYRVFFS